MKPIDPISPLPSNERITVPGHLLSPRGGEHYVLRVVGDSMKDEGIHEGDYVIVRRRDELEQVASGEMCVVLVGEDASIKRVYHNDSASVVTLKSANEDVPPIRVPRSEVKVQGVVVGLMRKF